MYCNGYPPSFLGSPNGIGSGLDLLHAPNLHLVTGPTPVYPYCETCVATNYYCKNTGGNDVDRFTMTCYTLSHFQNLVIAILTDNYLGFFENILSADGCSTNCQYYFGGIVSFIEYDTVNEVSCDT